MTEQQVREIAEAAFKARFKDIDIVTIEVKPGPDDLFDEPLPLLNVWIVYDAEVERVVGPEGGNGRSIVKVLSEIVEKVWEEPEDSPGWPYPHFISKFDHDRRRQAAA